MYCFAWAADCPLSHQCTEVAYQFGAHLSLIDTGHELWLAALSVEKHLLLLCCRVIVADIFMIVLGLMVRALPAITGSGVYFCACRSNIKLF